jgi:hypothetical protein
MAKTIVHIQFKLTIPAAEYVQAVTPMAQAIADVPGLEWKIWLLDKDAGTAGGVYLFANQNDAQAFLDGPLVFRVRSAPMLADFEATHYDVIEELTAATRGPIPAYVRSA